MTAMLNKVLKAIEDFSLIEKSDKICVAISGGADSVALLKAMTEIKDDFDLTVSAIHINHCLRGAESDADEEFVRCLCKNCGVPLEVKRVEVGKMNGSVELNARNVRYSIFDEIAAKGIKVATAHTASDNAETVLFNLARGSLVSGLCGIPTKRDMIIRPLIYCTREDTEKFAGEFVTDSSNLTDDYNRNLIRHKAVPVLKSINRSFDDAVMRTSVGLREIAEYLSEQAKEKIAQAKTDDGYDIDILCDCHPALLKQAVSEIIYAASGIKADNLHINGLCDMLRGSANRYQLSENCFAVKCKKRLYFDLKKTEISRIKIEREQSVHNLFANNLIDCDKIIGKTVIRTRQEKDEIRLCGRPNKTLKKLFNECGIPPFERDTLPLVADDCGVIFIPNIGVAERVRPDENSKNIAKVTVIEND